MKVSKAQAQANRAHVVDTASRLFREQGYDGVGVADLMAAAGFTHGGFYKQFGSKTDLIAEATACGVQKTVAQAQGVDPATFVMHYLSRTHRDQRGQGCSMAALGGDAARQPEAVRQALAEGIEGLVAALGRVDPDVDSGAEADAGRVPRERLLALLAQSVGALVMSRACPDGSALADEILEVNRRALLAGLGVPTPPELDLG